MSVFLLKINIVLFIFRIILLYALSVICQGVSDQGLSQPLLSLLIQSWFSGSEQSSQNPHLPHTSQQYVTPSGALNSIKHTSQINISMLSLFCFNQFNFVFINWYFITIEIYKMKSIFFNRCRT